MRTENSRASSPARASATQWAAKRVAAAEAGRRGGIAGGGGVRGGELQKAISGGGVPYRGRFKIMTGREKFVF